MMLKKWIALLVIVFAVGALLSGCSSTTGGKEQVIKLWQGSEPEILDPGKSTGVPEANYELALFEGLVVLDAKDMPAPAAAEKWEVSPDGLKYTFHLRANAKWSNGEPLTAYDFEYAWKRILSPELAAEYAYMLFPIKGAENYNSKNGTVEEVGIKAVDDKTLEVVLDKPTAYFLALATHHSFYPVNKKIVEANGDKWASDVKTLISNGPFKVANWVHNSKLEMVKNDQYWDKDKVKVSKLEWALLEANTTALSMFENNQLDYVYEPPMAEAERLKKENKLTVGKYLGTYYYELNNKKAPFDNPKVRKALALAIDRESLAKTVLKGIHKPADAWIPFGFTDSVTGKDFREEAGGYFKTDIAEAKKLLAEAGYPEGQGLPPITLIYNTSDNHKAIAETIQEMWKKNLGITIEIQNQEWKVYIQNRKSGNFHMARAGWIGDYADPMTFADYFMTNGGNNHGKYSNIAYDKLVETAQLSNDSKVRMQAMRDAERIFIDDMGSIPIYFYGNPYCIKANLKGVIKSATSVVNWKEAYFEN
ncbi:peptide ABC transporter substrate-binding protein [Pelosinus baikalensis]|uniref:Peptide ABC transporter substrate-binding protein n=1 Tax=Pelosinus baikalensis TaxID=2892015 RepID=A0ABS8HT75_9FIRM|nr:peptide ABC transporter substrate-binding protein [Pelosinus baikalensis]MCC5466365.1 peptide ABC transporter substrate-binding protein [Pelosinus baikalensis]